MKVLKLSVIISCSIFFFCCSKKENKVEEQKAIHLEEVQPQEEIIEIKEWQLSDFLSDSKILDKEVDKLYEKLSDKEKAAQLIAIADNEQKIYKDIDKLLEEGIAGSVLYLKLKENRISELVNKFQDYPKGKTQTLFMADAEPTLIKYKFLDYKEKIPNTIEIPTEKIDFYTAKIDSLLKKSHVKLNFSTIGDFGKNQAVINNRAWGKTKEEVQQRASQHIKATQKDSIGATLKHFPGHGNVEGDSHKRLVTINGKLSEYEVFKHIIKESHPVALMVGHIGIKNNELYSSDLPSTLNPLIMKDLIRAGEKGEEYKKYELNYKGLIVTDAMNMKAVSSIKNADFRALEAGADIILMPKNPRELNDKIQTVLKDKKHKLHEQVEQSVKRVLRYKICTQLIQKTEGK